MVNNKSFTAPIVRSSIGGATSRWAEACQVRKRQCRSQRPAHDELSSALPRRCTRHQPQQRPAQQRSRLRTPMPPHAHHQSVPPPPWAHPPCQTYARGRVALVGDAAHLATPFLGQGCSQALEDALELGRAVGEREGGWSWSWWLGGRGVHVGTAALPPACSACPLVRLAARMCMSFPFQHPSFATHLSLLLPPPPSAGTHGPTPAALAAYQAVRLPVASAVQAVSVDRCQQFGAGSKLALTGA